MIDKIDFNKLEELTKDEFEKIAYESDLPDEVYEDLANKEWQYRHEHGDSLSPDSNLCKYCRNNNKKQKFCWDCNKGSLYIPITRPLFNLLLMYVSLEGGMETAKNKLQQIGMRDAFKILLSPFGIEKAIKKFEKDLISQEYNTLQKIERAESTYVFKQPIESSIENEAREKYGAFRCHENVCTHCKYNDRFNTVFCYKCDAGTNFRTGIRSLESIYKFLMYINTAIGEGAGNDWKLYLAEGLKWAIAPYTTEEKLIDKYGFEYISQNDIDYIINCEDDEYKELDEEMLEY